MSEARTRLVVEGRSDLRSVTRDVEQLDDAVGRLEDELTSANRAGQRFRPPEFDEMAREAERAERSTGSLVGGLSRLQTVALATGAAVTGVAVGLVALTESSAEYQRDLRGLSFITGRSVDEMDALARAIVVLGGEFDDARDAILDFNERIGEARADPASEIGQSFRRVNFDVSRANSTLEDYLQTLNQVPDRRVALFEARTILGDTGARLLPLLVEGDLEGTIEANMDLVLSDEARRELEESSREYRQASAEFSAAVQSLVAIGLPAITATLNDFFVGERNIAGGVGADFQPLIDFFRTEVPAFQAQGPFQDQGQFGPPASTAQFGGGVFPSTSIGAFARGTRDFFAAQPQAAPGIARPTTGLTAEELDVELGDHVQNVIDLLDDFGTGLGDINSDISDLDLTALERANASFQVALEQAAPTLSLLSGQGLAAGVGTLAGGLVGGVAEQAAQRIIEQVAAPVFDVVEGTLSIVGDIFGRAADEQEQAARALQQAASNIAQQATGGLAGGLGQELLAPLVRAFQAQAIGGDPAGSIQRFLSGEGIEEFLDQSLRTIARGFDRQGRDEDLLGVRPTPLGLDESIVDALISLGEGDTAFRDIVSQAIILSNAFSDLTDTVQGVDDAERRRISAEFDLQEIALRQSAQAQFERAGGSPAAQAAAFRSLRDQLAGLEDAERAAIQAAGQQTRGIRAIVEDVEDVVEAQQESVIELPPTFIDDIRQIRTALAEAQAAPVQIDLGTLEASGAAQAELLMGLLDAVNDLELEIPDTGFTSIVQGIETQTGRLIEALEAHGGRIVEAIGGLETTTEALYSGGLRIELTPEQIAQSAAIDEEAIRTAPGGEGGRQGVVDFINQAITESSRDARSSLIDDEALRTAPGGEGGRQGIVDFINQAINESVQAASLSRIADAYDEFVDLGEDHATAYYDAFDSWVQTAEPIDVEADQLARLNPREILEWTEVYSEQQTGTVFPGSVRVESEQLADLRARQLLWDEIFLLPTAPRTIPGSRFINVTPVYVDVIERRTVETTYVNSSGPGQDNEPVALADRGF